MIVPEPTQRSEAAIPTRKNTGPTTAAGKARSRANALDHGLTGAGKVLPAGLAAEVARLEQAHSAFYKPSNDEERGLVHFAALGQARIKRCFELQCELEEANRRRDLENWDVDHLLAVLKLAQKLGEEPEQTHLKLLRTSHGCDWLRNRWSALAVAAAENKAPLTDDELTRMADLLGIATDLRPRHSELARLTALRDRVASGDATAAEELAAFCNEQAAELEERASSLFENVEAPEIRALAAGLRFDDSPAMRRLHRYEAAARRMFDMAIKQLERIRKETEAACSRSEAKAPSRSERPTSYGPSLSRMAADLRRPAGTSAGRESFLKPLAQMTTREVLAEMEMLESLSSEIDGFDSDEDDEDEDAA